MQSNEIADGTSFDFIKDCYEKSKKNNRILEGNQEISKEMLDQLQISKKSTLGSVIYHTSGILVDHEWIRILGGGEQRNVISWNNISLKRRFEGALLIADDVVGGFFAINEGLLNGRIGDIFYFAPDTLEWESLNLGYSDFIEWIFLGKTEKFYETFRWNGWQREVENVGFNQAILFYPYLWAESKGLESCSRGIVSVDEMWNLEIDFSSKI